MKTFLRLLWMLSLFGIVCSTGARDAVLPDIRVKAELRDGTRVVGLCEDKVFKFDSATLGDLTLTPEKISGFEVQGKTNLFRLTTTGGDALTVKLDMEALRVKTSFGLVRLPAEQLRSVRLTTPGKADRPTEGLVGYWPGNGNANDVAGENNGVVRNGSYTDGVAGQAFSFDPDSFPYGTWTGVQLADKPTYELTQALTIEGWVRPRGNGYIILCRGDHRPGTDPYCLSMQGNHALRFQICDEQGGDGHVDTDLPYSSWTHVAAVFDGDAGTLTIFTNGQQAAQTHTDIRPLGRLRQELSPGLGIGNLNDGGNNFPFIGDIDEISLYDRALAPEEVKGLYEENAASAGQTAGMRPGRNQPQRIRSWNGQFPGGYFKD